MTVNISPAALVRSIDEDPPTLLLDEADTIFGSKAADNHEDLRGIINSGHQRNRPYVRWDMMARKPEHCPTFAMAALASIGDLPDTIMDRAVVVRMRRRAPDEVVSPYRTRRDAPPLHKLRDRICEWARLHVGELQAAEPDMPVEDRAADTWEPLVAVADLAAGEWPARARKAVTVLVAAQDKADMEANLGTKLLADIKEVFTVAEISSADLVADLCKLKESPWDTFGLDASGLAYRLKAYGVRPDRVRPYDGSIKQVRGYKLADFADAFSRYVPADEPAAEDLPSLAVTPSQPQLSPVTGGKPVTGEGVTSPEGVTALTSQSDGVTASDAPGARACTICSQPLDPANLKAGFATHPMCGTEAGQ
jgi:hypothetical protein